MNLQIPGIRTWTSLGGIISQPTTSLLKFPTRLPLSSAIQGQHPGRAASGSLWLVHSAGLQGHTRSAPRQALCQQDSPTLLGRLRVYTEVFHSLFFCDQLHEARGEMLFNSFTDKIQKGSPVSLRQHIQKAVKWSSEACLSTPSQHTFCCLHDTLGEGGQQSVIFSKESYSGKLYSYFTSLLLTHEPTTRPHSTITHTHTHTFLIQHHTQALIHSQNQKWEGQWGSSNLGDPNLFLCPGPLCSLVKLLSVFQE